MKVDIFDGNTEECVASNVQLSSTGLGFNDFVDALANLLSGNEVHIGGGAAQYFIIRLHNKTRMSIS